MTYFSDDFTRPNVLQMDSPPVPKDGYSALTIRCPHCMNLGTFPSLGARLWSYTKKAKNGGYAYFASIRICPNESCSGIILSVTGGTKISGTQNVIIFPPETIDFDADSIPPNLLLTLKEAIDCHAAGADRAAAMMVRRLLEELCDASGANGKNLHDRLADLKGKITLPQALFDAMGELKALGNDAAHIQAKAFDNIGPEEAADSIELAKEILKALYQLDGLVKRLQARKKSSNTAP